MRNHFSEQQHNNRRKFIKTAGVSLTSLIAMGLMPADRVLASTKPKFKDYPFTLGVASGDPLPDGVVLWTKLAPQPLAEDGLGGMPNHQVPVNWEVAKDQNFRNIVKRGVAKAIPELAHSVHVEVTGLEPWKNYYYRFKAGPEVSPIGRTKTAPSVDTMIPSLSFAFASCQAWYHGYYTAYKHMAEDDLDLVFFLGDYIYEYPINSSNLVRPVDLSSAHNNKVVTLDQYRLRYSLFKTDPDLQAAHAAFPWVITWDDHEVENNYADEESQYGASEEQFLQQRADAYQAHYENLPLRSMSLPQGPNMRLYRKLSYGKLAEFNVLDTRQYRDDRAPVEKRDDPNRTMLGKEQEQWLLRNLNQSNSRWNVMAQQVVMAEIDRIPGPGETFSMDQWDGYVASRERIFSAIKKYNVSNPIVLTGDIHRHAAINLKEDFTNPDSPTIGTEFVTTSITSGKDGSVKDKYSSIWLANDHVKFYNGLRGYAKSTVTPEHWKTDHLVLPYVTQKGAPIETAESFLVENGKPGLQEASKTASTDKSKMNI